MTPFGSEGFDRELLNIMARNTVEPVFHAELLAPLGHPQGLHDFRPGSQHSFKEIFIGYDPASGTGFSEAVALSMIFDTDTPPPGTDRRAIIVGAERVPDTAYNMIADWLVDHGLVLRQKLRLPMAQIVICIENNSILVAQNVARAIEMKKAHNVTVMREQRVFHRSGNAVPLLDARPGIHTTHANKEAGINAIRALLLAGAFQFHVDFCVPNAHKLTREEAESTRRKVLDEFSTMSAVYIEPKTNATGMNRLTKQGTGVKYMGYRNGGQKAKDDFVMAAIFCLLCYAPYHASAQFHAYKSGQAARPFS